MFAWSAPLFGHFADRWSDEAIDRIIERLKPFMRGDCPKGCSILDVGGGTGALGRRLHARLGAQVTVLDPTPQMLRYIPANGPVRAVLGQAEAMPFADDSFDAVIVTDAFHHFRNQAAAAHEFARVVRCGGGVIVYELDPRGFGMRAVVAIERLLGEPGAFFEPNAMCSFMAANSIEGICTPERGVSYRFVGLVKPTDAGKSQPFQR